MYTLTERDLLEASSLNRVELLYVHASWCIWHEGVPLYDGGFPGAMRDIHQLRTDCVNKQHHHTYARDLIESATNVELHRVFSNIQPRIDVEHHLGVHFRWVAYHEAQRRYFLDALSKRDFTEIRKIYYNHQSHNGDTKFLLQCVNNAYIENMLNNL